MESVSYEKEIANAVNDIASSVSAVREVLESLRQNGSQLDTREGISLLSLKQHILISYLQSLLLLTCRRAVGDTLLTRTFPTAPFSASNRPERGSGAGDLVDLMLEDRIILEKVKSLEAKMRYQIDKLIKLGSHVAETPLPDSDPLSYKPNPQNLVHPGATGGQADQSHDRPYDTSDSDDDIYRPPRVAAMPYTEKSSRTRKDRQKLPSALASLALDPSRPHAETASGLGSAPAAASGRVAELRHMTEYEEENFTRLVMKKRDAKRRARDEEDLALGAGLLSSHRTRRRAGDLQDEFDDVLKSISRPNNGTGGGTDGYEELRHKGRKEQVLTRSRKGLRVRKVADAFDGEGQSDGRRKRSRFELERKAMKKKVSARK